MQLTDFAPWLALAALGAYHGINPAMGWLFAVSLGLQDGSRKAVYQAFVPIALGHTASVAAIVAAVLLLRVVIPLDPMKFIGAAVIIGFGIFKLLRPLSHPRWVSMRMGFRSLTVWSFLMASAHGAGLMLIPILFNLPIFGESIAGTIDVRQLQHVEFMSIGAPPSLATLVSQLTAVSIHTLAMFSVMVLTAVIVFEKVGLAILRSAWLNLDKIWAISLIASGLIMLVI